MSSGSAIVVSAALVFAIYAWRWFTGSEPPREKLSAKSVVAVGGSRLVSPEGFLVAWGTVYLVISVLAGWSEALASSMAISVLVGDILANGVSIAQSTTQLREEKTPKTTKGAKHA